MLGRGTPKKVNPLLLGESGTSLGTSGLVIFLDEAAYNVGVSPEIGESTVVKLK